MFNKNEYIKKHYQENKQYYKNKANIRRESNIKWFIEYKDNLSCKNCGFNHPAALDFHHRNPKEKDNQICVLVNRGCSIKRIEEEISKCDILCANCHRILHYNEKIKNLPL